MTVLAGFFYRGQTAGSDQTLRADLVATLSRNPADRIEEVQSGRCFLAKIDIGAFGASGVCRGPDGATTMLVGDPIGEQRAADPARTRAADAQEIHQALLVGNLTPLSTSRGAFCVAHHDEARGRLILATDRAGLRPMYFCNDGEHVVFATALRILESIPSVRKVLHLAGFADLVHFGTELGNRSPYLGIKRLRAGEMLVVGERETKTSFYWKWDDLQESSESPDRLAQTGADVVAESVSVRTGTIRSTTSMLTGGLDSRVIVTLLRERGIDVRSINFSIAGSQDQTFARQFAELSGTQHEERPSPPGTSYPDMSALLVKHLRSGDENHLKNPGRLVWHGFDGSFTLGYVHVLPQIVSLLRDNRTRDAAESYLRHKRIVWPRSTKAHYAARFGALAKEAIESGFSDSHFPDPGRRFYHFHFSQEARALMRGHFEDIDLSRIEYLTPFYDMKLIEFMHSVPIEYAFNHDFYMKVVSNYPESMLSLPWQTYPGHQPCPLPIPRELEGRTQWEKGRVGAAARFRSKLSNQRGWEILTAGEFPHEIISRLQFSFAYLVQFLLSKDYTYATKMIGLLQRHLAIAGGHLDDPI
ncbi:asparagine synthase-related protein [Accumulibacter sp.]|uniref:asparagine synthase-related protein n=1 Tax=Accumulibacter sp. TaxID=2053492 RepID=UPI0026047F0C|nr:asparagine synthase-related protein [Accumulibacter sp.]